MRRLAGERLRRHAAVLRGERRRYRRRLSLLRWVRWVP